MTAMLWKELYVVGKQTRTMLVCVAGFFLVPHFCFMGIIYLLAFSAGLTYSAAYDERRWDRFAAMLPVSPWKIVGSKYLFYMAAVCGTGAVAAVSGWVQTKLLGGPDTTAAAAMAAALAIGINAVFLPTLYRLGAARFQAILSIALAGAALLAIGGLIKGSDVINNIYGLFIDASWRELLLAAALAAAGNIPSFYLSVRFYTNRRYGIYN